jgi:hypothetical protein
MVGMSVRISMTLQKMNEMPQNDMATVVGYQGMWKREEEGGSGSGSGSGLLSRWQAGSCKHDGN